MKRNKLAAAALALALATPVVANAAEATSTSTSKVETTAKAGNGVGNFAITEEYRREEAKYVEAWKEVRAAQEKLDAAKVNEATAKAAYEKALKALRDFEARYGNTVGTYSGTYGVELQRVDDEIHTALRRYYGAAHAGSGETNEKAAPVVAFKADHRKLTRKDVNSISKYIVSSGLVIVDQEGQAEAIKDLISQNERYNALVAEVEGIENKRADLQTELYRRLGDYNEAVNKRQEAQNAYDAAVVKYEAAKIKFIGAGASRSIIAQAERDGDVSIVTTVTTTTTPAKTPDPTISTSTSTVVGTAPAKTEKGITAEQRKALEKAVADAEKQIAAVQILKDTTPKTIKDVVGKLDRLVAEQEVRLATARAALAKSTASNVFFSVAHADDENLDVDKLIEDINDSTKEIQDVLKENEAAQPEVEDAGKEKVEDEKEDNKDDKKEETKVIEKTTTVVTPAASNKTAGSNAKTGIAGVAGVAGVLAAATAAYAASKKN